MCGAWLWQRGLRLVAYLWGLTATGLRQCVRWPMLMCFGVVGCDAAFIHPQSLRACLGIDRLVRSLDWRWRAAPSARNIRANRRRYRSNTKRPRAGKSPIRATTSPAAIGGRSIGTTASIRSCRKSRFPIRQSRLRLRPMNKRAPSSGRRNHLYFRRRPPATMSRARGPDRWPEVAAARAAAALDWDPAARLIRRSTPRRSTAPGISTSGARFAGRSRATRPPRKRARPISIMRNFRRKARSPPPISTCAPRIC